MLRSVVRLLIRGRAYVNARRDTQKATPALLSHSVASHISRYAECTLNVLFRILRNSSSFLV
jgi:hypothetical protein